jgi:hypothetical protein
VVESEGRAFRSAPAPGAVEEREAVEDRERSREWWWWWLEAGGIEGADSEGRGDGSGADSSSPIPSDTLRRTLRLRSASYAGGGGTGMETSAGAGAGAGAGAELCPLPGSVRPIALSAASEPAESSELDAACSCAASAIGLSCCSSLLALALAAAAVAGMTPDDCSDAMSALDSDSLSASERREEIRGRGGAAPEVKAEVDANRLAKELRRIKDDGRCGLYSHTPTQIITLKDTEKRGAANTQNVLCCPECRATGAAAKAVQRERRQTPAEQVPRSE